jgi:hypothetical protein
MNDSFPPERGRLRPREKNDGSGGNSTRSGPPRAMAQSRRKWTFPQLWLLGSISRLLRSNLGQNRPLFFAQNLPELAPELVARVGLRDQIKATLELPPCKVAFSA